MFANTNAMGQNSTNSPSAPAPVAVPFPNKGDMSNADKGSTKVIMSEKSATNVLASQGDEAGTSAGVSSAATINIASVHDM